MARRALRIVVSLLLMAALLAAFLWNVDLDAVAAALGGADPTLLLIAVGLSLVSYWLRAVRWQLLLLPMARVRHSSVVLTTAVGYAGIALLPARLGEVIRPLLLAHREKLPVSGTVASVVTERILDLWTVLAFFLVFVVWPPDLSALDAEAHTHLRLLEQSGLAVAAALLVATVFVLALLRYQDTLVDRVTRALGRLGPRVRGGVRRFLHHFLDGLRGIQRPRELVLTLGASLLVWWCIHWQLKVTLLAFDVVVPLRVCYLLVVLTVIGLAVPTPGGIGGFHKALQIGLTLFLGVGINLATGVAVAYHAVCFGPITLLGLAAMVPLGVSLGDARRLAARPEEREDATP